MQTCLFSDSPNPSLISYFFDPSVTLSSSIPRRATLHSATNSEYRGAIMGSHGCADMGSKMLTGLRSWSSTRAPVPKRYISVDVVGKRTRARYLIPIPFLTHADFQKLLEDSVVEFGHSHSGVFRLVCEEEELRNVLRQIGRLIKATKLLTGHCLQPSTWYCVWHSRRMDAM